MIFLISYSFLSFGPLPSDGSFIFKSVIFKLWFISIELKSRLFLIATLTAGLSNWHPISFFSYKSTMASFILAQLFRIIWILSLLATGQLTFAAILKPSISGKLGACSWGHLVRINWQRVFGGWLFKYFWGRWLFGLQYRLLLWYFGFCRLFPPYFFVVSSLLTARRVSSACSWQCLFWRGVWVLGRQSKQIPNFVVFHSFGKHLFNQIFVSLVYPPLFLP